VRIFGIDPGCSRCGWGVIDILDKGQPIWVAHGCIETEKTLEHSEKLNRVFNDIMSLIEEYQPNHISLELLFLSNNRKTVMQISEARGVILLACAKSGLALQTFQYTPMQVKLAVTGYGRSDKKEVIQEVIKALNPVKNISSGKKDGFDDAADALAVAMAHFHKYVEEGISTEDK